MAQVCSSIMAYSVLNEGKQIFAAKYLNILPSEEELKHAIAKERQLLELQWSEPELIEDDIVKTTIPLCRTAAEKLPDNVAGKLPNKEKVTGLLPDTCRIVAEYVPNSIAKKLTPTETAFLNDLLALFAASEWITNTEAREASGKSESSVKRLMRNLTEKGALVAKGETRDRWYRLHKKA